MTWQNQTTSPNVNKNFFVVNSQRSASTSRTQAETFITITNNYLLIKYSSLALLLPNCFEPIIYYPFCIPRSYLISVRCCSSMWMLHWVYQICVFEVNFTLCVGTEQTLECGKRLSWKLIKIVELRLCAAILFIKCSWLRSDYRVEHKQIYRMTSSSGMIEGTTKTASGSVKKSGETLEEISLWRL